MRLSKSTLSPICLRVLHLCPGGLGGRGGMAGVVRYLTSALYAQSPRIDCRVIDTYGPGPFGLMPFFFALAGLRLAYACAARQVDVVHIHMAQGGSMLRKLMLLRLAGVFRVPVIVHIHGSRFDLFTQKLPPILRRFLTSSVRRAARIVVLGHFWRDYVVGGLGLPLDRVVIIPNGVPLPFPPSRRAKKICHIVSLGLVGQRKGTPDLLRALAEPELADYEWHVTIAGNGEVDACRDLAEKLGLSSQVVFMGWVDPSQVPSLLLAADIFVLPSHHEGLPVAIMEAMASALPVVATPVGAVPDLVVDGITGIVVPVGKTDLLASALLTLIEDPVKRASLGAAGRRRIEEEFTIDKVSKQFADLYDSVSFSNKVS